MSKAVRDFSERLKPTWIKSPENWKQGLIIFIIIFSFVQRAYENWYLCFVATTATQIQVAGGRWQDARTQYRVPTLAFDGTLCLALYYVTTNNRPFPLVSKQSRLMLYASLGERNRKAAVQLIERHDLQQTSKRKMKRECLSKTTDNRV